MALTGFPLPPLLVGLGFGDRAVRRFAERMASAGRYHVFRSGSRYFLNGELVLEGPYRKRGHAAAGAWIERNLLGQVTAEQVVCFDEALSDEEIARRACAPKNAAATVTRTASAGEPLRTA